MIANQYSCIVSGPMAVRACVSPATDTRLEISGTHGRGTQYESSNRELSAEQLSFVRLASLAASHQLSRNGCPRSPENTSSTLVLDCARDVRARAVRHGGH